MKKYLSLFQLALIFVVGILLAISFINSVWSGSVDLAHHYALAFRIAENLSLSTHDDPSLGDMNYYPGISHAMAAIAGLIFNSTFLGIQFVSLFSLAMLWGAVIYIFNTLILRTAFISSIGLMCLMIVNRHFLHFEVHGAELVSNFFYSQLVAQAVVVSAIAIAIFLEIKKYSNYAVLILLIVITNITVGIHLLPALELLGVVLGIAAINIFLSSKGTGIQRLELRLWYVTAAIVAVATVFFNPSFKAFRKLSENNGSIAVMHISSTTELVSWCVFALVISFALLYIWYKRRQEIDHSYLALKYLGLYGTSIALLCLMQIAILNFGYGSEYATKKYAFGLFAYLFISIPVLIGLVFEKYSGELLIDGICKGDLFRTVVVLLTYAVVYNFSIPSTKLLAASDIVSLETKLVTLRNVALTTTDAKNNVVIGLANMPPTINYMFSIAIMRTPVSIAIPDVLVSNRLGNLNDYKSILTSVDARPYFFKNCNHPLTTGSIALLDAACVKKEIAQFGDCVGEFDLTLRGEVDPSELSGFSIPEDHGRWTDGKSAKFSCTIAKRVPTKIRIDTTPFLYGLRKRQRLIVTIKNTVKVYDLINASDGRNIEIVLPECRVGEKLNIEFNLPDAISPQQVGFNADTRQLGVSIKSISFK